MSAFDDIGSAGSAASLAVAKALGIQVSFNHRSGGGNNIDVNFIEDSVSNLEVDGRVEMERVMTLEIPVQTNFAKATNGEEPIVAGDTITYLSRVYSVIDPIETRSNRSVYIVRCIHNKVLSSGIN